ncbi:MAG: UTP--glucose-1-phosphate uridylyltransferase GalU [Aquificae bacterium]|nr:UTP--glucose-1-phosphate uridylyltransferase GalU [Aquificota bacterium]
MKAVIPVAGWGTRFLPATKAMPKEMLPLVDKPVIQYIVEELLDAGIRDIVLITGRHKRAIEDHFDLNPELEAHLERSGKFELLEVVRKISRLVNPVFIRQKEQKGLGHAVLTARPALGNEPFVVALGDIVVKGANTVSRMLSIFSEYGRSVLALFEVPPDEVSKYGIAKVCPVGDGVYRIEEVVEKPSPEEAPSNLAVVGRYLFTPTILEKLEKTPPGKGGEIQLTDAIAALLEEEEVYAFKVDPGSVFDTGNKLDYLKTVITFALEREELKEELERFLRELLNRQRSIP